MPIDDLKNKDWKACLSPDVYAITREQGTEPPFSGKYYKHHEDGHYTCACCGARLFSSETKYESGSGWPSFWQAVDKQAVTLLEDTSHGMRRIEVRCKACDAHLGHVFPDGPKPTGERYCINSLALGFEAE